MGIITFNSVSSATVGINVETFPTYETPERDYESIHVPGRNGDVVIDTGTFRNTIRSYKVSMVASSSVPYYKTMNKVAEWLHSGSGYCRLEDTYEPDYYTYGYYKQKTSFENLFNEAGRATLNFECKPQRYLKTGDDVVTFSSPGTITNPTKYTSLPIITITTDNTTGTVGIGNCSFTVKDGAGTITVNSETQDVYTGTANKNYYVTLVSGSFPTLESGSNTITFSGGVTKVEIIPKWWTI